MANLPASEQRESQLVLVHSAPGIEKHFTFSAESLNFYLKFTTQVLPHALQKNCILYYQDQRCCYDR